MMLYETGCTVLKRYSLTKMVVGAYLPLGTNTLMG
jgi:hypothetical protein